MRKPKDIRSWEVEVTDICDPPDKGAETDLRSSGRTVNALNSGAISPSLCICALTHPNNITNLLMSKLGYRSRDS